METEMKAVSRRAAASYTRLGYYVSASFLVVVDYFAVAAAAGSAIFLRDAVMDYTGSTSALLIPELYAYGIVPCVFLCFIAYAELYTRRLPLWNCAELLFKICLYVNLLIVILTYFLGKAESISRLYMILFWALSFLYLCAFRYITKRALIRLGIWQIPVVIVGAGKTAELLAKTYENDPGIGYRICGLIEDKPRSLAQKYPNIGSFADADQIIAASGVDHVVLAAPGLKREQLIRLICRIQPHVKNLTIVPDLFGMPMGNISLETIYNEKTLLLHLKNNLARRRNRLLKRSFDLTLSLAGSLLIAPILACIAACIYISSPGPVIFAHRRIGAKGKTFPCYKFRSMAANAEELLQRHLDEHPEARREWQENFKLKQDPRVTKIGGFLRKTSLDELPQLINVIKGEMSLVGPRPIVREEIAKYGDCINDYYLVRPGMTGHWQVSGRSDVDYDGRVQMDVWYIRNWSMWQDIVILIKTVKVVLGRDGAY